MQEMWNDLEERFNTALMAQAYAYPGQRLSDVLSSERIPVPWTTKKTAPCARCEQTFPVEALFPRGGEGPLCNDCESRRLEEVMG